MPKVKVTELRRNLPDYLARVERGEEIEVTVHGRVIARIVPQEAAAKAARARLIALRATARVGDIMSPSGDVWNAERGRC